MPRFKVGDRIRRVKESDYPRLFGEVGLVYTVLCLSGTGNPIIIRDTNPGADATCFELAGNEPKKGISAFIQRVEKEYSK
jgi:hypothetical protein